MKPLRAAYLSLAGALLLPLHATAAPNGAPERVALMPLEGHGISREVRERLESLLHDEMARLPGLDVVREEASPHPPASTQAPCAIDDLTCASEVGTALAAHKVVRGHVSSASDGLDFELSVVDVPARVEAGRLRARLDLKPHGHAATLRRMATQLLVPEHYVGSLLLSANERGAQIFVDGVARGRTPLSGPIEGLPPGKHLVEARLEGRPVQRRFVVIQFGETTTEALSFPAAADPSSERTQGDAAVSQVDIPTAEPALIDRGELLWFSAGGAVAGLGVVALSAAGVTAAILGLQPKLSPNADVEQLRAAYEQYKILGTTSWVLAGAGVVFVGGGAALSTLPLWGAE